MEQKHASYQQLFNTRPNSGQHPSSDRVVALDGAMAHMHSIVWRHLVTNTIRDAMHWLSVTEPDEDVIVWDFLLKYKNQRDGYRHESGRFLVQMSTMLTSLYGHQNSNLNADLLSLNHCAENNFSLSLLSQLADRETYIIRVFGMPDPRTGRLIGLNITNVEDTGSLEKSLGRRDATSDGRFIFTHQPRNVVAGLWDRVHVK